MNTTDLTKRESSDIWNNHFKTIYNNEHDPDDLDTVEDTEFFDDEDLTEEIDD